jgi:hypothetical protein
MSKSLTTTEHPNRNRYVVPHRNRRAPMLAKIEIVATLPPMHPGEMLREEYLKR